MLSLILWTTLLLANLLLTAAASAWAARKVGSPRGRFSLGLLASIIILVVNVALAAILPTGEGKERSAALQDQLVSLAVLVAATLVVFLTVFKLSFARAFAPFGAAFAVGLLFLVLILTVLRPKVSQAYRIPMSSMAPTFEPGDRFFVNKLARPRRWDVITYWVPQPTMHEGRTMWCKRVVGLPGEELRFEGGQLYVNNQLQSAPAVLADRLTAMMPPPDHSRYADGQSIRLGANEVFVLGDNLPKSADSRLSGPVELSNLDGVVDFQYWPFSRFGIKR
jgi:signal peptidase I